MDVLNSQDTRESAIFLLRQLLKGENTSVGLRNSMIHANVDDSYFKFIIEELSEHGYIIEVLAKWQITPQGVRYIQDYENRLDIGSDWSIESVATAKEKKETEEKNEHKWNRKMTILSIVIGLLSLLIACINPLVERGWQAILSLILDK